MRDVLPLDVIEVENTLGEGVQWNPQDQSVWWTDIQARRLYRLQWPSRELEIFETPERLCAFAFTDREDCIVAAFERGFALYDYRKGKKLWEKTILPANSGMRFNDGKMDRQGRFWAGTMVEDASPEPRAGLYRLEAKGAVTQMADGIHISNGSCWSPDSRHFYFADTPRRNFYAYDFDPRRGELQNRRLLTRTLPNRYPDGATVDAEGYIWCAHWRGARVERYAPDGSSAGAIPVPVSQPTCAAFGGENMDLLFVTSARDSLAQWTLGREPLAGSLFVFHTPFRGLPEARFAVRELLTLAGAA